MKLTSAFVVLGACCWLSGCRNDGATSNRFEKADLNHDGLITQPEAGVYIGSHLFDGLDKNHDAKISRAEWNAGGDLTRARRFQKCDQNQDGFVTEEELKVAAVHSHQLSEFMTGADRNRDGALSKPEALTYYASKEGPVN